MANYQELTVWKTSFELSLQVYKITNNFPKHEVYGLSSQMRRAAVSIPSNIAEGNLRGHTPEYVQFIKIAQGSLAELETQLMISKELSYIDILKYEELQVLITEIGKMLHGLLKSITK